METLAGLTAVRMRTYDAFADALNRGIHVEYLDIESAKLLWLPESHAIVISSHVDTMRERRDLVAHAIAHADIEKSQTMRKYRAGRGCEATIERRVRRIASRRLIHTESLAEVLTLTRSATEVADLFDVTIATLADRIRDMTARESRLFGRLARQLAWPNYSHTPAETTCGIGHRGQSRVVEAVSSASARAACHPLAQIGIAAAAISATYHL
ncbi:ImmA/IrrE family metallo-endopeptidase [Rhodococcoides fascians]|uniref:ImmA/IrrE family metallo-endopeptidase n=1 Tax=Rhodococcoides fascians TaxID=1828 RepID=UPI00050C1966|nr:ImmA/IrrE family metallo-endopeptidase [Rhodococcus fascians]